MFSISTSPSWARSLIARNTDQGVPRRSHTAATADVSMSTATTPAAASCSSRAASVMNSSEVDNVPRGSRSPNGWGVYSVPVAPSTTTAGTNTSPMANAGSTPPAMPTTTTRSTGPVSSTRSAAAAAATVPIEVVVATMSTSPCAPS
jgi:hypothetical protein